MTNKKNKIFLQTVHFVKHTKLYIAGGGIDGTIIFFFKPPVDNSKETQLEPSSDSFLIKKDIHRGKINHIDHNQEFVIFGGNDNKISIWKIMG